MNICRICMRSTQDLSSIFIKIKNEVIANMITDCADIDISRDDGLPEIACKKCISEVRCAYKLRKKCQDSDRKLRQTLSKDGLSISSKSINAEVNIILEKVNLPSFHDVCDSNEELNQIKDEYDDDGKEFGEIFEANVKPDEFDIKDEIFEEEHSNNSFQQAEYCTSDDEPLKPKEKKTGHKTLKMEMVINEIRCCGCEAVFQTRELLEQHSKDAHESERTNNLDRPHECEICFKRYLSERGLKSHRRDVYLEKTYQCLHCGKRFYNKTVMTNHERSHTGERPYGCESCYKRFTSKANLLAHVKLHAEIPENTRHLCKICSKGFSRKSYLKHHYALHSEETPFACKLCPSKFKAKQNLKLHMRVHTGEKPYSCDFCERKFSHPSDKKRHQMNHTGLKPFKCDYCGKTFTRKGLLQKHERTHTGERPFECEICFQKYSTNTYLQTHLQTHYGSDKVAPVTDIAENTLIKARCVNV